MFDLGLPQVRNVNTRPIGDTIKGVKPMSLSEAANGRPIRPYPKRYDDFHSMETLMEYIEIKVKELKYSLDWLEVSEISSLPLNLSNDVYYTGGNSIAISAYKPTENIFDDIRYGGIIVELNPTHYNNLIPQLKEAINKLRLKK